MAPHDYPLHWKQLEEKMGALPSEPDGEDEEGDEFLEGGDTASNFGSGDDNEMFIVSDDESVSELVPREATMIIIIADEFVIYHESVQYVIVYEEEEEEEEASVSSDDDDGAYYY